jgi:hypothetical protein
MDNKDSSEVPVTRELICWLCTQGCDLASTAKRERWWRTNGGRMPEMIADLVRLSETVWPVAAAISYGDPFEEVEQLVQQSGTSIHEIRDSLV